MVIVVRMTDQDRVASLAHQGSSVGAWKRATITPLAAPRHSSRMTITDGSPWSFACVIASTCVVNWLRTAKKRRPDPTDSLGTGNAHRTESLKIRRQ